VEEHTLILSSCLSLFCCYAWNGKYLVDASLIPQLRQQLLRYTLARSKAYPYVERALNMIKELADWINERKRNVCIAVPCVIKYNGYIFFCFCFNAHAFTRLKIWKRCYP